LALRDYEKQKEEGKDPVFDPRDIGVENAHIWNTINKNENKN
jgi:AGCS family alanine or glycine:cation symporter